LAGTPEAVRNPYRVKKPRSGVLLKGRFYWADEKGRTVEGALGMPLRVTSEYCWISSKISIPVPAIVAVETINKDRAVLISYANVLTQKVEQVCICALTFFGRYHRKKNRLFRDLLLELKEEAPSLEQWLKDLGGGEAGAGLGCERCGSSAAAPVEMSYCLCVGFYPFLGLYLWDPKMRYLCRKHARRACVKYNLLTSFLGYWGFPGVFLAPYCVWRNIASLRKAHPTHFLFAAEEFIYGIIFPLAAILSMILLARD